MCRGTHEKGDGFISQVAWRGAQGNQGKGTFSATSLPFYRSYLATCLGKYHHYSDRDKTTGDLFAEESTRRLFFRRRLSRSGAGRKLRDSSFAKRNDLELIHVAPILSASLLLPWVRISPCCNVSSILFHLPSIRDVQTYPWDIRGWYLLLEL